MSNELKAKRSKLIADQKAIIETATKEVRKLTSQENETLANLKAEVAGLTETISAADGINAEFASDTAVREVMGRRDYADRSVSAEMSDKDVASYSLMKAIRSRADNRPLSGLEKEVNDEIARRVGKSATGFYVPTRVIRSLDLSDGTGSVSTVTSSDYIDVLRANALIAKLGAQFIGGLQGKFNLPRISAGITSYWVAENNSPTAGAIAMDNVAFVPKTLGGYQDITRAFLSQTSVDAENMVKNDLIKSLAVGIDTAAIKGGSNAPTGILATSSIGDVAVGTNGGTPSYANLVDLETAVANANVDTTNAVYLMSPKARGLLKKTAKIGSTYPNYLWDENNEVNGYKAYASNIVPSNLTKGTNTAVCSAVLFANFSDLIVGTWGALDLTVDLMTLSSSGGVRIVALQDADIQVRHPESFAAIKDVLAT